METGIELRRMTAQQNTTLVNRNIYLALIVIGALIYTTSCKSESSKALCERQYIGKSVDEAIRDAEEIGCTVENALGGEGLNNLEIYCWDTYWGHCVMVADDKLHIINQFYIENE